MRRTSRGGRAYLESATVDFDAESRVFMTQLSGGWARERQVVTHKLDDGLAVVKSSRGASSYPFNPRGVHVAAGPGVGGRRREHLPLAGDCPVIQQHRCQAAGGRVFPSGRHGDALAPSVHLQAEPRGPVAAALSGDGCCGWHPCGPHAASALPDDRACSQSDGAGNISAKEAWVRAPKPPSRPPPRLVLRHTFERMTAGCRSQPAQPPHRRQRKLRPARGPSVVDADTKPRIATSHATDVPIARAQAHESCTKVICQAE
jgi:hypothetical protein